MKISTSLEDYLKAIYTLDIKNDGVRVTDISDALNVKKSSTNNALNLLKDEGLINYEKYKNVTLTDIGLAKAKHLEKRNQLFISFLKDIIKTDEELASEEAEKLSHCISCHTTAKLEAYIEGILSKKEEM